MEGSASCFNDEQRTIHKMYLSFRIDASTIVSYVGRSICTNFPEVFCLITDFMSTNKEPSRIQ